MHQMSWTCSHRVSGLYPEEYVRKRGDFNLELQVILLYAPTFMYKKAVG